MPTVVTADGEEFECTQFKEGDGGIILQDGRGREEGWFPFEDVERVLPDDE